MSLFNLEYDKKRRHIDDILGVFENHDFIVSGLGGSESTEIMSQIHRLHDLGLVGCKLSNTLPMMDYEIFRNPAYKESVHVNGWFYSAGMRKGHEQGHLSFQPQHLHRALDKRLWAMAGRRKVLVAVASPMDKHGYLSLSVGNTYEMQLIRSKDTVVILEVSPHFPRTFGDNHIHIRDVHHILETQRKLPMLPETQPSEKDEKIGKYIAEYIEDESTIQLGIGGIPNAVAKALKSRRHLGIHTEMFTDGMVDLIEAGVVTNASKTLYPGKSICTFALGSQKLYDYIDDNPAVFFMPGRWTNDPYVIAQNKKMVSINTTIEVDLTGQCCSETIGHRQFSGTGGQADTAIGAQYSEGGKSFIALYSTANVKDEQGNATIVSKIVPVLKPGAVVSLSRNDVDYVVTEFGIAHLRGQSIDERVKRLIRIAHPDFRESLEQEAKKYAYY